VPVPLQEDLFLGSANALDTESALQLASGFLELAVEKLPLPAVLGL
jgi:hypothetical protein